MIKLFKVLKRIEHFIYRLKLLINLKIHDMIFVAHLKSVIDSVDDSYRQRRLLVLIVIMNDEEKYEIEKLLRKRTIKRERD